MKNDKFYTRVLTQEDKVLVAQMEKIEFRTQKNAWNAQSLLECFDDSYLIVGLFYVERLIGFAVIYNTKITTDLLTIGVDPEFQGRKLGSMLLRDTLQVALEKNIQECFLEVRVSNYIAQNLYKKYGFEQVGIRKNYYNAISDFPAEDALTMQLSEIKKNLDKVLAL